MSCENDILLNDVELSLEIGGPSGMYLGTGFLQPMFLCGGIAEKGGLGLAGLKTAVAPGIQTSGWRYIQGAAPRAESGATKRRRTEAPSSQRGVKASVLLSA